jgi:hypothetical protein
MVFVPISQYHIVGGTGTSFSSGIDRTKLEIGEFIVDFERKTDKGIDNRARQLSTPEARQARPNCNTSRNTSSCRMSIL